MKSYKCYMCGNTPMGFIPFDKCYMCNKIICNNDSCIGKKFMSRIDGEQKIVCKNCVNKKD